MPHSHPLAHATQPAAPRRHRVEHHHGAAVPRLPLTPQEAAQVLGSSRAKLDELLRAGAIESVRIDRLRRVPTRALHDYVERLRGA